MKTLFLFIFILITYGQVFRAGEPLSKKLAKQGKYLKPIPKFSLPYMNSDSLRAISDTLKDRAYFAYTRAVNISFSQGIEDTIYLNEYGDSIYIWRIRLSSPGAYKIDALLDTFWIPCFTEFYVYSPFSNKKPFRLTCRNNKPFYKMVLGPVEGSEIILEYNAPLYIKQKPKIHINGIAHEFLSYNTTANSKTSNFGTSAPCQKNVMCKAPHWCKERRSVVMLRYFDIQKPEWKPFCSGVLLNNERRDGRPYLLTAFHCLDGDKNASLDNNEKQESQNWQYVFNYMATTCANPATEPLIEYYIYGAKFHTGRVKSDFALLELSARPPGNFNAYYAGWDRTDFKGKNRPKNVVGIHHPKGDIKKISTSKKRIKRRKEFYGLTQSPSSNAPLMKVWKVKWTEGGTQGGSSGSPLFYKGFGEGYVIGQVSKGNGYCAPDGKTYYGRFSTSWSAGGTKYSRLREWLNPNYTQVNLERMSGEDPCKPSYYFENANDLHTSDNVVGTFVNPPGPLPGQRSYDGKYLASDSIVAGNNVEILPGTSVEFFAQRIRLKQGFHAKAGSHFLARIEPCIGGCQDASLINFRQGGAPVTGTPSVVQEAQAREIVVVNNAEATFRFYPNPTTGISYVKLPSTTIYEISVRDLLGREILRKSNLQGRTELNLSGFPKGIYFLQVQTEQGEFFREKVILE